MCELASRLQRVLSRPHRLSVRRLQGVRWRDRADGVISNSMPDQRTRRDTAFDTAF